MRRNTLGLRSLVLLLLLLLAQMAEGQSNNNNNKNKRARAPTCKNKRVFAFKTKDLKASPVHLRCAQGPVVGMDIAAIRARCRGSTGYTRWSAGRCMWNDTCELTFQDKVIDQLDSKVKDKSCLGQVPARLEVSYTCLKKKVTVTDTLGTFKKTKRASGIIRSHKLLPWSYRNGKELGNVTFIRPRKPVGVKNLWISVHLYAILNKDLLFLSWEEDPPEGSENQRIRALRQILPNDTTFSLQDVDNVILTFYADYGRHQPSRMGGEEKGFLLCYQWLKTNQTPKRGSACSKVMMPAKCKSKKRGGRRGRKKPQSRNSNNNKNSRKSRNRASRRQAAPRQRRPSRIEKQ